jgi:integrase
MFLVAQGPPKKGRPRRWRDRVTLALNAGMRDGEIKRTQWSQIDFAKAILTVGRSKTAAGEGRTIPLNSEILEALLKHAKWYVKKFGELRPEWYVFPFGRRGDMDPARPVTTLKTAWTSVRKRAVVSGRWHDARHTLITELAEGVPAIRPSWTLLATSRGTCSPATAIFGPKPDGTRSKKCSSGDSRIVHRDSKIRRPTSQIPCQ